MLAGWVAVEGSVPGDSAAVAALDEWLGGSVDRPMVVVRRLTDLPVLAVVAAVLVALLLRSGRRLDAVFFALGVGVVWAVNPLLKELFSRSRPGVALTSEAVSAYGFPSGHAANTAALVGAVVMVLRARVLAIVLGAVLLVVVGFAQLAIGVHYPSDILAGWFWAGAWITLVWSVRRRCLG
jgi:membrane-associated phospholipid phosphatase